MNKRYLTRVWSAKGWQTVIGCVVWEKGALPFKKTARNGADKWVLNAQDVKRLKIGVR